MIAAALARHIAELDFGTYDGAGTGAPVFLGDGNGMPDKPDVCWAVYTLPSFPRSDPTIDYETPEVQAVYRTAVDGPKARPGAEAIDALRRALDGTFNTRWAESTVDEVDVLTCDAASSTPVPLDPDARGRPRWSVSFQLETPIRR
ncbi:minor capsid protein [Amycolatopsis sp., V23-08]|uniref:Minor capsid protein n=1 Tax=Amycolatopsis heterodermiae TaxID=3110235 RepID=A0ABU5RNC5_9PSEU|nr:minor capsid protein [Amycolatopsis sp., V23-08]MEA5367713.1 minor capsid protein [Amycolatopsis sp., V23-08]